MNQPVGEPVAVEGMNKLKSDEESVNQPVGEPVAEEGMNK